MHLLLLLSVAYSVLLGGISAENITVIKLHSMATERQRRNDSLIQPKQSATAVPPGEYTMSAGDELLIESPNFPDNYPNNFVDSWFFQADDSPFSISCAFFDVKRSSGCRRDYLEITYSNTFTYRICGEGSVGPIVIKDTNTIEIKFRTNRRGTAGGFSCSVSAQGDLPEGVTTGSPITTTTDDPGTGNDDCTCGVRNTASRIVGGEVTSVNEYPWQVALTPEFTDKPFCGGSIISDQWILTAAHCVDSSSTINDRVVTGEHDWSTTTETSARDKRKIIQVIRHPNYNDQTLDNDIALLKLLEPITFSTKVSPVCLATPGNLYADVDAIVTGWGTLETGGSQPNELHEVTVPTMTNAACKETAYSESDITDNMICAGLPAGGKDSCQGDSGGPMVTGSGSMQQIGIVSWGYNCAVSNYPGVYTRVSRYVSWIETNISGSKTCNPA